jgi:CBS domain-containing protein
LPCYVVQKLSRHNILSAPVYDDQSGSYIGFLDTQDLVKFCVFCETHRDIQQDPQAESQPATEPIHSTALTKLKRAASTDDLKTDTHMYGNALVGVTIAYLAHRHKFQAVFEDASLLDVINILANKRSHRVPVLSRETNRIIDIVSQSSIANFLYQNREAPALKQILYATVSESQIGSRPVITAPATATAFEAFKILSDRNVSGIAIVDQNSQRCMYMTSGSDLRQFLKCHVDKCNSLHESIPAFLSKARANFNLPDSADAKRPDIVTVSNADTVGHALELLVKMKIHRVIVVDQAAGFVPEAVISISDILRWTLLA